MNVCQDEVATSQLLKLEQLAIFWVQAHFGNTPKLVVVVVAVATRESRRPGDGGRWLSREAKKRMSIVTIAREYVCV